MVRDLWRKSILLCTIFLTACTIGLVPAYDQSLVQGLDEANTAALTVFAELENGKDKSAYPEYESRYAGLIGKFDALGQRASNRQVPPLAHRLAKLKLVSDICDSASDPAACVNASPASIAQAVRQLRTLRDRHKARDLKKDDIELLRGDYETAMQQALYVENALKR